MKPVFFFKMTVILRQLWFRKSWQVAGQGGHCHKKSEIPDSLDFPFKIKISIQISVKTWLHVLFKM